MPADNSARQLILDVVPLENLTGGDILFQTAFWGRFKAASGWIAHVFSWTYKECSGTILLLERSILPGVHIAYIPYGPDIPPSFDSTTAVHFLCELAQSLRTRLSPHCFALRFDLQGGSSGDIGSEVMHPEPLPLPLRQAPYRVQPPDTVIVSLAGSEDEILKSMHKKTRYNIRLAEKKGITIQRYSAHQAKDKIDSWYELYRETAERDKIGIHPYAYYQRLFSEAAEDSGEPVLCLYMAEYEQEELAGIIVSRCGKRSTYMYGASSSKKRELMPNYLLQWAAIADARKAGALYYDLFGIPPSGDSSHPLYGLWRFKTGFGGKIHHYHGAWDYPYKMMLYRIWCLLESLRRKGVERNKKLPGRGSAGESG